MSGWVCACRGLLITVRRSDGSGIWYMSLGGKWSHYFGAAGCETFIAVLEKLVACSLGQRS